MRPLPCAERAKMGRMPTPRGRHRQGSGPVGRRAARRGSGGRLYAQSAVAGPIDGVRDAGLAKDSVEQLEIGDRRLHAGEEGGFAAARGVVDRRHKRGLGGVGTEPGDGRCRPMQHQAPGAGPDRAAAGAAAGVGGAWGPHPRRALAPGCAPSVPCPALVDSKKTSVMRTSLLGCSGETFSPGKSHCQRMVLTADRRFI